MNNLSTGGTVTGAGRLPQEAPAAAPLLSEPGQWGVLALALTITLGTVAALGGAKAWGWVPAALLAFAGMAAMLVYACGRNRRLPCPLMVLPMLGFGGLVCAQLFLHRTASASETLNQLMLLAAAGCVYYLAVNGLCLRRQVVRAGAVLWLAGGALAIEAILQHFTAGTRIYWLYDASYATPVGPYVYHNHFAGCMDLLLPIGAAYIFTRSRAPRPRWLTQLQRGLLPGLALIAAVLANSRGGILSLGFELLLALAVSWRHLQRRFWVGAVAAGLLLAGAIALTSWQPLVRRFEMLQEHDVSAVYRVEVTETCVRIFRDYPWLGTGFGSFAAVYPQYQTFDAGVSWDHAHNEYAQMLAETGLVGAGLVLAVLLLLAVSGWRLASARPLTSASHVQLGALVGAGGFLFHSAGDFQFHNPANLWLFFLVVAIGTASVAAAPGGHRKRRKA